MSTISLKQVTKLFGSLRAADAVDLEVGAGEVVCLLGPSGCGKTTTLRMIAGLETATAGDIVIGGQRVNDLAPAERNIAMVFQFYALYPSLTVRENLAFPLQAERISREEIAARVDRVARTLDLTEVLDRIPGRLAEGEKQRVAVGRAIIRDPTCFLFDEPLVAPRRRAAPADARQDQGGAAGPVQGHGDRHPRPARGAHHGRPDRGHARRADRADRQPARDLRQARQPVRGELHRHAADEPDAGPLQPAARAPWRASRSTSRSCGCRWTAPAERLTEGAPMTLGIRPRAFDLASEPEADTITADADLIEPMGAETLVHAVESGRDIRVVVNRRQRVRPGDRLHLRAKLGQVHLFGEDERRIGA